MYWERDGFSTPNALPDQKGTLKFGSQNNKKFWSNKEKNIVKTSMKF